MKTSRRGFFQGLLGLAVASQVKASTPPPKVLFTVQLVDRNRKPVLEAKHVTEAEWREDLRVYRIVWGPMTAQTEVHGYISDVPDPDNPTKIVLRDVLHSFPVFQIAYPGESLLVDIATWRNSE